MFISLCFNVVALTNIVAQMVRASLRACVVRIVTGSSPGLLPRLFNKTVYLQLTVLIRFYYFVFIAISHPHRVLAHGDERNVGEKRLVTSCHLTKTRVRVTLLRQALRNSGQDMRASIWPPSWRRVRASQTEPMFGTKPIPNRQKTKAHV